jgi:hypothetical protein
MASMRLGDLVHLAADPTARGRVVRLPDAWHVRVYWLAHPTHARRWTVERIEALERAAPTRRDESGRPCPTVPCPRCGRPVPRGRIRAPILASLRDWRPFDVTRTPAWCGHPVPMVALPRLDGWWENVLVWEPNETALNPVARWEPPGSSD